MSDPPEKVRCALMVEFQADVYCPHCDLLIGIAGEEKGLAIKRGTNKFACPHCDEPFMEVP